MGSTIISNQSNLPFLTAELGGIGGIIKKRPGDFYVEEVPAYAASGEGTHAFILIEKTEITTMDAIGAVARGLGIARKDVGYAGLKDARAVARQWLSVEHVKDENIRGLDISGIKIIEVRRHTNKLKIGHMAGNKFIIKLRQLSVPPAQALDTARQVLEILHRRGVPNYYGPQRFGNRNDSHLLGESAARGRSEEFIDRFLGRPEEAELPAFVQARKAFDAGDYRLAHESWPYNFSDQRRAMKVLIETGGNKRKAYNVIDKYLKRLLISAFQSDIFNRVLAARMPGIDKILEGDMAYKHENGAMFRVEDAAAEQARCDKFEISPTGPLVGIHMRELTGPAGEIENPIIAQTELSPRDLEQIDNYARGGRRPMRFQPKNWAVSAGKDDLGEYLEFRFEIDSGCYATTVLREIVKFDIS